ncbi:MAG TPA: class I SAM-dependent methyltransferase, partial [Candidatus Limnocylindrales bacterium]
QTYFFPGGQCPSLAVIERAGHDTRLLIRSVTDIAPDFARTLRAWRTRFMAGLESVGGLGFDERFIRMWEYYLAINEAGFATGISQDLQIAFEKRRGIA